MKGIRTFEKVEENIVKCRICFDAEPADTESVSAGGTKKAPEAASKTDSTGEAKKDPASGAKTVSGEAKIFSTEEITATLEAETGNTIWTAGGEDFLTEGTREFVKIPVMAYTTGDEKPVIRRVKTVDGERNFIDNLKEVEDHFAFQGRLRFCFSEGETIHGLGQAEDGVYDYRHHTHYMYQHNMRIPMPMFVSSKGYGVYFDAGCLMTFREDQAYSGMFFDCVKELNYYIIYGPSVDRIIEGFRKLTGEAVMLPKWAYGYVQSKEQYYSAKELADIVKRYRDENIPIDCIVQDWNSWEKDKWGNKILDPERYGDIEEQSKRIHDMNCHTMVSVWPNMNSGTENYDELLEAGFLLNDLATYDAFDERAREIYWKQAKEGLFDRGFDSFWCDSTEPFSGPDWGGEIKREPEKRYQIVGDEHKKYLPPEKANLFALAHAQGIYENQRKTDPDKRVLNLTRSGYAGGQKYAAMLWSGDTYASWETLQRQITEGLNMGLSGYPFWTLDIGGFFVVGKKWQNRGCGCNTDPTPKWFWTGKYDEGVKDRGYCELYTRWLQMGTFLPMFRSHGTDTPREIWNFGKPGDMFYDAIAKFIKLRYSLMPYIYSMAGQVRLQSFTMMRSLLFDFPEDEKAAAEHTEFMFGKAILVCPVTKPMYYEAGDVEIEQDKNVDCYLPAGSVWYDMWTGILYEGGKNVRVKAGIDIIPVFIKGGSIIPMQPGISYAAEVTDDPLEIHVYTGEDGSFLYYDDAGEGYGYENGECETVLLTWNNATRTLTLGERKGSFPGMRKERKVNIFVDGVKKEETVYEGREKDLSL